MRKYIKRCREDAGLTQEDLAEKMEVSVTTVQNWESGQTNINMKHFNRLAELFNIPVENLIREKLREEDMERCNLWPDFLFDEEINAIIDVLHLNLAQQELLGLIYIYGLQEQEKTELKSYSFDDYLKYVPYGFVERVGSIRFMNMSEGLRRVIRYVKPEFLLKVIRINPESEFDVRKLSKDLICEFIDEGHKPFDDYEEEQVEGLNIKISMRRAKVMLPFLEQAGAVHITDGWWSNPIRADVPEDFLNCVCGMCSFEPALLKEGYYKEKYNIIYIRGGLESVTEYKNVAKNVADSGEEEHWELSINDKGEKLLKWLGLESEPEKKKPERKK